MHKRFEELCALAATGQITGEAMAVLDLHVKECTSCRTFLEDVVPLKAHVAPVVAATHVMACDPPEGIRERFLERAAAAGISMQPGRVIATTTETERTQRMAGRTSLKLAAEISWATLWYEAGLRLAVPVAAAAVCGFFGYYLAIYQHGTTQKSSASVNTIVVRPVAPVTKPEKLPDYSAEVSQLREEKLVAAKRLEEMTAELTQAHAEKRQFQQEMTVVAQRAAAGMRVEQQFKVAAEQLENAENRISKLQGELQAERVRVASADAITVVQQRATDEANHKVIALQAQLDRETERGAGKNMAGEMISARNLHIIDVYDAETNGQRKRAFGRVFYVEGKSLVFYAYDLPAGTPNSKVEFRVWGEKAGVKSVSIGLGALRNDNTNQGRWVLTCTDPRVLNRINAIFVTSDPSSRPAKEPRGPKTMYAFLGSPNHP